MRLYRLIRYRYPYTAKAALLIAASVAMLFWHPLRWLGGGILAAFAAAFIAVAAEKMRARR